MDHEVLSSLGSIALQADRPGQLVTDEFANYVFGLFEPRLHKALSKIKNQVNRDFELLEKEVDRLAVQELALRKGQAETLAQDFYRAKIQRRCIQLTQQIRKIHEQGLAQMKRHIGERQQQLWNRTRQYYQTVVQSLRDIIQEKVRTGQRQVSSEQNLKEFVDSFLRKAKSMTQLRQMMDKAGEGGSGSGRQYILQAIVRIRKTLDQYRKIEDITLEQLNFLNELAHAFDIDVDTDPKKVLKSGRDCFLSKSN